MSLTLTTTAYSATPRLIHEGVYSVSFDYTSPSGAGNTLSASANATTVLGPKIPNGTWILGIVGNHSSGAATCPVDIGLDATLSALTSQKAQGATSALAAANVPYKVSVSDDAAAQYQTLKFSATPGTDTAVVQFKYTVLLTRDI